MLERSISALRLICFAACAFLGSAAVSAEAKPNIVYVLVDNWGWGDISIQGGVTPTPHVDALARQGLRMTNFNVESQCTPTRAAIMTARLPIRSGTSRVPLGEPYGLTPWEYTLAELLSDAGYKTALYGKWHLGDVEGRLPTDQGFDEWYGIKNTSDEAAHTSTPEFDIDAVTEDNLPYIWKGKRGEAPKKVEPYDLKARDRIDRRVTELSEKFIRDHAKEDAPFFLFTAFTQIHTPMGVHPDFKNFTHTGVYSDILAELDFNIGRIIDALDRAGVANDTILIVTGDNGTYPQGFRGGSNGPWRGGFTGYEGGLRTVGVIRWPGKTPAGAVSDEIFASLDWMPTLAAMIGESGRVPKDRPLDGVDQSDFLLGKSKKSNREYVLMYIGDQLFSVKWRTLKVHYKTVEDLLSPIQSYLFPPMYDVSNDPGELNNIFMDSNTWVFRIINKILAEKKASMAEYPNVQPGEDFKGYGCEVRGKGDCSARQ